MKKVNTGCLVTLIGNFIILYFFYYLSYKVWCWLWT